MIIHVNKSGISEIFLPCQQLVPLLREIPDLMKFTS
jgi:hypothetical protein